MRYGLGLEAGHRASSQGRLQDVLRRRPCRSATRARARARGDDLRAQWLFCRRRLAAFIEIGAQPVINSTTELAEWDAFVAERNWRGGAALHVDTGMNRLGISVEEAVALAPARADRQSRHHALDEPPRLRRGRRSPAQCRADPAVPRDPHCCTAAFPPRSPIRPAIFLGDSAHCDLARPGAALYGINPTPGRPNPMRSVVELTGRILQVRSVDRGDDGRLWRHLDGKTRLAHRRRCTRLCRRAPARRQRHPRARGAWPASPASDARLPAAFRWIWFASTSPTCPMASSTAATSRLSSAAGISVDDVAASAGTIGYEILTRLGPRCHLVYRGA